VGCLLWSSVWTGRYLSPDAVGTVLLVIRCPQVRDAHQRTGFLKQRSIKVLLVDSDEGLHRDLQVVAEEASVGALEIDWVGDLEQALSRMTRGDLDAVLLSLAFPHIEGLDALHRACASAPDVPIIVISAGADEEAAVAAVQSGAQDFLVKGQFDAPLLIRSVRHAIERHRLFAALRSLSLIDDLTGLYNRRGFTELGGQHLKLARRSGRSVTMVFVDLDDFKVINDSLGHHVGDRALVHVAEILGATFRRSDIVARLGGDEFCVLALEAADEDAELLVTRLRDRIRDFNEAGLEPFRLSASVGMVRCDDQSRLDLEAIVAEADAAMYREKREKRSSSMPDS